MCFLATCSRPPHSSTRPESWGNHEAAHIGLAYTPSLPRCVSANQSGLVGFRVFGWRRAQLVEEHGRRHVNGNTCHFHVAQGRRVTPGIQSLG